MKDLKTSLFLSALVLATASALGQNNVLYAWRNLVGQPGGEGSADGTNSAARFDRPSGVAMDRIGNLFVVDRFNNTIRKVTPVGTNWVVTTVAGLPGVVGSADGMNSAARFDAPRGVAVDSAGNLYVADRDNNRISLGTPLFPTLTGALSGSDVIVSWPSLFTGFVLQTNADLGNAGGWQNSAFPISADGTNQSITVPALTDSLFFRLRSN